MNKPKEAKIIGISGYIQHADWKTEKHVPVITCADVVSKGQPMDVELAVGKNVAHPNTTEHHIRWIHLYFKPAGGKFVFDIGRFDFTSHGESTAGANQGPVHTDPVVTTRVRLEESGTLHAISYCNIHGLWEGDKEVTVQ
jgi:superoxide reductase